MEDLGAGRTEDVVAEAEVFVEHHGLLGDPLMAVLASDVVGFGRSRIVRGGLLGGRYSVAGRDCLQMVGY